MKDNYNFKVFENYKCDGQLKLVQNGDAIDIIEDTNDDKKSSKKVKKDKKKGIEVMNYV